MMSKDIQKNKVTPIRLTYSELENLELPVQIENIYFPDWDNEPPLQESIMKRNDTHLIGRGGMLCLCAEPGVGKSSVVEAWVSSHLNTNSDSLGVKVSLNNRNAIVICDTERSQWESHKAWSKLMKRANIEQGTNIKEKLIFANLKQLNTDKKKRYITTLLNERNDIGMIVFDGSSDFLNNTNDLVETNKFIEWISALHYNVSFIFTIHTNPGDNKPRGHLGSELCRKAECVILATRDGDDFKLSTDFENGKNRHGKHETWYYKYCTDSDMFISKDYVKTDIKKPNSKYNKMALEIFAETELIRFGDIVKKIEEITGKTYDQSKSVFFDNFQNKICRKELIEDKPFWRIIR